MRIKTPKQLLRFVAKEMCSSINEKLATKVGEPIDFDLAGACAPVLLTRLRRMVVKKCEKAGWIVTEVGDSQLTIKHKKLAVKDFVNNNGENKDE